LAGAAGGNGEVFSHLPNANGDDSETRRRAAAGISCTFCLQITNERLGTRESFNGEFVIKPTPADGARVIFGTYRIDAGRKTIMRSVSGFEQAEGSHIRQSESSRLGRQMPGDGRRAVERTPPRCRRPSCLGLALM
jgi:hypothetical protein